MREMVNFNLQCFLDCANELLRADETERALHLLDNLPAYYRDHKPREVIELKREAMARLATASFYATSRGYELTAPPDSYLRGAESLRGIMIAQEIKTLNENDLMPHVLDLGPGEYWLPQMLNHKGLLFTYEPIFVNHPSHDQYQKSFAKNFLVYKQDPPEVDRPKILFAGEIIEHLWNESEIRFEMERHMGLADVVHISTPAYTFDYECIDWRSKGDIGHLRAYTPSEFQTTVWKMFPEYATQVYVSQILHARGVLQTTKFETIKNLKVVI